MMLRFLSGMVTFALLFSSSAQAEILPGSHPFEGQIYTDIRVVAKLFGGIKVADEREHTDINLAGQLTVADDRTATLLITDVFVRSEKLDLTFRKDQGPLAEVAISNFSQPFIVTIQDRVADVEVRVKGKHSATVSGLFEMTLQMPTLDVMESGENYEFLTAQLVADPKVSGISSALKVNVSLKVIADGVHRFMIGEPKFY